MEAEEEKERGKESKERMATTQSYMHIFTVEYAQIDWHSFVIVETINFRESEAGKNPSQLHLMLLYGY